MATRVVVADDNKDFLRELVAVLRPECEIVATAQDGQSALRNVLCHRPDVAVLDLKMPELNAIEVTRKLAERSTSTAVVICSVESDPDVVEAALRAGALGYVFKQRIESDLISAVKSAATGRQFISPT